MCGFMYIMNKSLINGNSNVVVDSLMSSIKSWLI